MAERVNDAVLILAEASGLLLDCETRLVATELLAYRQAARALVEARAGR